MSKIKIINEAKNPKIGGEKILIETINDLLKNTAQIVHSRHRSVANFIINIISALGAPRQMPIQ